MSSYVDMSLEDIIKKKRQNTRVNKAKVKGQPPPKKLPITDARNKIISKKRTQITDAREKLAQLAKQKDARLKLEKLRLERARITGPGPVRNTFPNRTKFMRTNPPPKERVFTDSSRQVVSQPFGVTKMGVKRHINSGRINDRRPVEKSRFFEQIQQKPKPILRTVENDLEIIDDPMGDEYIPKATSLNRKASLQLKIVAHNNDIRDCRVATIHRNTIVEKEKSPPRPPSILKKRPMAAMRSDKVQKPEKPHLEYRIIVSNLRNTVTGGDIEELFGDVGGMVESRLVRPGTAEVIYKTQEDAQKAVDLYHNRQLDGQPMNCLLVTPRSPSTAPRTSNKPELYSTNSNVEPDISTFHKVLFSNL
ncbi:polymerase delta-interacting protein 3-like isoform X1 [Spodoptera litura]|uniref:Polymerase delta-interacting protein 3-like isoform X1 n=1 Tax=Spodoptera litura TaxID=69820 RepID=A0A9J7IQZ2_SPOLT|nr:polymerase delta-interacting protein 3-like isoform X1 [Spodoptera litura]